MAGVARSGVFVHTRVNHLPQQVANLIETWGGLECTVNRVGNTYLDQLELTGHAARHDDLDRIAGLGITTLRYPVLWERHVGAAMEPPDWRWADARLDQLRRLGMRPIAGLVHHGSGPLFTHLLDAEWPAHLARYARQVAERYPWIDGWTPVNEPLTTARFSGLYGHWYPHAADDRSFVRALLNQIEGIARAMQAIREVNPAAQLIQTEDLAHVQAVPALAYQARFENHRRWLTFDLLCGRVGRDHPMYSYLRAHGASESELQRLRESPTPPDLLGVNYYVLSERFLDNDPAGEPLGGGNGRHRYNDRPAVRSCGLLGFPALLRQVHERYALPVAVTEAHLAGTRDEQLRWLRFIWDAACEARAAGIPVQAITIWSLFGAYDWDSLCTSQRGHYEPGAFDVRGPAPRATALAAAIRELATGGALSHPVLDAPGWWQR